MKTFNNKIGFTLLELIVVIIIVGVLAGLALPRFFATVEYARSVEALNSFAVMRGALERCYLQRGGTYVGCTDSNIGVETSSHSPNAHFNHIHVSFQSATGYMLSANRNTLDGGDPSDQIFLLHTPTGVSRWGTGAFSGLQ